MLDGPGECQEQHGQEGPQDPKMVLVHTHPGYNNCLRHKRLCTKLPVNLTHLLFICHASSLIPSIPIALCIISALLTPSLTHTHCSHARSLSFSLTHKLLTPYSHTHTLLARSLPHINCSRPLSHIHTMLTRLRFLSLSLFHTHTAHSLSLPHTHTLLASSLSLTQTSHSLFFTQTHTLLVCSLSLSHIHCSLPLSHPHTLLARSLSISLTHRKKTYLSFKNDETYKVYFFRKTELTSFVVNKRDKFFWIHDNKCLKLINHDIYSTVHIKRS